MKHIREKSEAEKMNAAIIGDMTVAEYNEAEKKNGARFDGWQWHCARCNCLFEADDKIRVMQKETNWLQAICPRMGRWGRRCNGHLSGAKPDYFEREYHITPIP